MKSSTKLLTGALGFSFIVGLVRPLLCLFIGLVAVGMYSSRYINEYQASQWPTVDGTVRSIDVTDAPRSGYHSIIVSYLFQSNGKNVIGSQNQFDDKASAVGFGSDLKQYYSDQTSDSIRSDYKVGSHHAIHVNPSDPSQSAIDVNFNVIDINHNGGLVVGVMFIVLGIVLLVAKLGKQAKNDDSVFKPDRYRMHT